MRKRNNRITVYLNDDELARLNKMVGKTIFSREQFIRSMLAGYTIREAPPAPLSETVWAMKSAAGNMQAIANQSCFKDISDVELLRKTVAEIRECVKAFYEASLPEFKEKTK